MSLLVLGGVGSLSVGGGRADLTAEQILRNMVQSERTTALQGEQVVTSRDGKTQALQKVMKKPPQVRQEFVQPARRQGELIVNDGVVRWHYLPQRNIVLRQSLADQRISHERRRRQMAQLRKNFKAALLGSATVANRDTYVIEIKPQNPNARLPYRHVWVDKEFFVRLKAEHYSPDGQLIESTYFQEITFNPSLPSDAFAFEPRGMRVVEVESGRVFERLAEARRQAPFPLALPPLKRLPSGFEFDSAIVRTGKQPEVWVTFTDGLNVISLFQRPLPKPADERSARPPRRRDAIVKLLRGYHITLIGLPPAQLRKIAAAVRLVPNSSDTSPPLLGPKS